MSSISKGVVIALMVMAPAAFAETTAPLPTGFKAEATSKVTGVFAHAVTYGRMFELEDSLRSLEKACIARGRIVQYVGEQRRAHTLWWIYRKGTESAVFQLVVSAKQDVDNCRVTFEEKREVRRSTQKIGEWPWPFHGGRFKCDSARNCYSDTKFGVKERCSAEGNSFHVFRDCVSVDRGPSRGMLLEAVFESDDMNGHGFYVRQLIPAATIDASLFDRSRPW